jgi:hypothetical protein
MYHYAYATQPLSSHPVSAPSLPISAHLSPSLPISSYLSPSLPISALIALSSCIRCSTTGPYQENQLSDSPDLPVPHREAEGFSRTHEQPPLARTTAQSAGTRSASRCFGSLGACDLTTPHRRPIGAVHATTLQCVAAHWGLGLVGWLAGWERTNHRLRFSVLPIDTLGSSALWSRGEPGIAWDRDKREGCEERERERERVSESDFGL